jgi:hypothetical protein
VAQRGWNGMPLRPGRAGINDMGTKGGEKKSQAGGPGFGVCVFIMWSQGLPE